MQPADLLQRFQVAASAGKLEASTAPGVGDLLASIGRAGELDFTGGSAGIDSDTAWLTGTATFLGANWPFRLTGKDAGDATHPEWSQFKMSLTPPGAANAGWTFANGFPGLPPSWIEPAPLAGLQVTPSVLKSLVISLPLLTAANIPSGGAPTPRFGGSLVLAGGPLARYAAYVGTGPLPLDGTATFDTANPDASPVLKLLAIGSGTLTVGPLTLGPIGIQLRTDMALDVPDEDAPATFSMPLLYGRTVVGSPPLTAELTALLLSGDFLWTMGVAFDPGIGLSQGLSLIASLFPGLQVSAFQLPPGLAPIDAFKLTWLEFGIQPPGAVGGFKLVHTAIDIKSTSSWDAPIAFVRLDEVGARFYYRWGSGWPLPTATLWGQLTLGAKKGQSTGAAPLRTAAEPSDSGVSVLTTLTMPDMQITATLLGPIPLTLPQFFSCYYDGPTPTIGNPASPPTIDSFEIAATLGGMDYAAFIEIGGLWSITAGAVTFSLDQMSFQIQTTASRLSGELAALTSLTIPGQTGDLTRVTMLARARYPGDGAWEFEAELGSPLNVTNLVAGFTGSPAPSWVPVVEVTRFVANYSTATGNPYSVSCLLTLTVPETLLGTTLQIAFGVTIERPVDSSGTPLPLRGALTLTLSVNRFEVAGALFFADSQKTYMFSIAWNGVKLIAQTRLVGADAHQALSVRLEGVTLGSIVEFLVNLANPNANYRLDPPWDFLNAIDLARFELIIDQKLQTISLKYNVDIDIVFARLSSVGLIYDRAGGEGSVRFVVEGSMLGEDYSGDKALQWDAVKDNPPSVPGKGEQLFDLHYLGVGQHVTPAALAGKFDSISQVIDTLVRDMVEVDDPADLPVGQTKAIHFDAASQWLLGLDCTVMDTVRLQLVLHDPDLYGVLISLQGAQAQSLAGFSFELYYRKVTADIGVFHARLQVPDAFRQLQFGAVSVTLGVITLDIFTNGNFRVDLGFPKNRDFTDSFAVEVTVFNGHGGIYFALLDGATSDRVPRITNGTFSPVLELGVGLMVGAGRTFNKGPLSASLYVDLVVIFEGVLGWFHPSDTGGSTALYYWAQGTAGIVGKLYGKVDFKIISVSVSIEVSAFATVTLAAHQPTHISLDADVQVEASVECLFFTINFHFGLHLSTTFTIGSESTTPWQLAPGQTTRSQNLLSATAHSPARRRGAALAAASRATYREARAGGRSVAALAAGVKASGAADTSEWHLVFNKDAKIFPGGGTRPMALQVTPAFTIADLPVQWDDGTVVVADDNPAYRIALLLSAQTPVPPDAQTIADTRIQAVGANAQADDPGEMPFSTLAEAVFRWTMDAAGVPPATAPAPPPTITLGLLLDVTDQLTLSEASSLGFTSANLDGFLTGNVAATLSGTPGGSTPSQISAAPFPMIPALRWSWSAPDHSDPLTREFWNYRPVGAQYEADVVAYFAELDPRPHSDQPDPAARLGAHDSETTESMASFVFRDYFLMVARAAVQAASDYLAAYPHAVLATDSLQSIAGQFPSTAVTWTGRANDTVDSIAAAYGLSAAEFLALNPDFTPPPPGQSAAVNLGVTVQAVADSAAAWPVTRGLTVPLGNLTGQVQASQTLHQIASEWLLADATSWITSPQLRGRTELLRANAAIPLTAYSYANPQSLSLPLAAAVLFVRLAGGTVDPAEAPLAEWYVEAIVGLGPYDSNGGLKSSFAVPSALYDTTTTLTWTTLPGDTLLEVATALSLAQNVVPGSAFDTWLQAVQAANPQWTQVVALPSASVAKVAPRDTLDMLAQRLFLDAGTSGFAALVGGIDLLMPLADIPILAARMATQNTTDPQPDWTLLATAQRVGLALEDFAARAQMQVGLLKPQTDPLMIRDVPVLDLETLVTKLRQPIPSASISGQVSRFMLNGLRLPTPVQVDNVWRATGPMAGLYDLAGQQLNGPAPSGGAPGAVVFSVAMTKGQTADWLQFAASTTTSGGERVADEIARGMLSTELNPALRARADPATGTLPQGMIVLTGMTDSITISVTEQNLIDNYPATLLSPAWIQPGLQALPLSRELAVQRPLSQPIRWRTTVAPVLPATPPAAAQPSLWLLSADLTSTASAGESPYPFDLMQLSSQAAPGDPPQPLAAWAWATLIDISVQRVPGAAGTLELFGADTSDRQRLAQLLMYLGVLPLNGATIPVNASDTVTVALGWTLPPGPGSPNGLTTAALDPVASFLIKANLSTETHSGNISQSATPHAAGQPSSGEYFASFAAADLKRLLTLVWECSVVGGGGYWLRLVDPSGAQLVPDAAFDQDGRTLVTLVLQLGSQSQAGTPTRNLYAFNNTAVIGEGIDPGSVALYAVAAHGLETRRQATVRPGEIGFTLDLTKPAPTTNDTPELRAERVFSLLGYQLTAQGAEEASHEGQPLAPQIKRDKHGNLVSNVWNLMRVVPVDRFYVSRLPDIPGLPPIADDPYAGINPPTGPPPDQNPPQQSASVALWFHDLLGNTTAPGGKTALALPVTYTDPLIAPGAWPATTLSYELAGDGTGDASLEASVSFQGAVLQPGGLETGGAAGKRAKQLNQRFARTWYQVSQPYVTATISTTLKRDNQGKPIELDARIAALRGYAGGAYVLSTTLATLGSAAALASEVGSALTPASVTASYGVDYDALGAANGEVGTNTLFTAGTLQVPQFVPADPTVSVAAQCPLGVDPQTVLNAAQNSVLPLQPGTALITPAREGSVPVPGNPQDPTPPLTALLAKLQCTLEDFAAQNAGVANLLNPGALFSYNGFTVTVGTEADSSGATLNGVMNAFIADGVAVTVPDILRANGEVPNLFRPGAPLVAKTYVAVRGDTIATNASGSSQAVLAGLNTLTVGLFAAGSPLYLQTLSQPAPAATLADFARQQGVTPGDLFAFNPNAALPDATVPLPGRYAWPADATGMRMPLYVQINAELATIAANLLFAQGANAPLALAELNQTMPDTVNGGLDLTIGGATVTTVVGDSFAAVYTRAGKPIGDFVTAVQNDPAVLAQGALLIAPPAVLPGQTALKPVDAARPFGVTALALLAANAGTPGLLVPGVVLLAAPGSTASETIAPHDTLASLLYRFIHRGITSSIDQLLRANPTAAFLTGGANLLLPPADAVLTGDLGTPANLSWSEPIFAVHAFLGLKRAPTLCDEALAAEPDSGVVSARSALPPVRPNNAPGNSDPGSASLVPFATALETALPALRVATGKVLSEDEEAEGSEIWVAVFGSQGIGSVSVTPPLTIGGTSGPQPRTYALRPLANTLMGRDAVRLQSLDLHTGGLVGSETRSFQAIDLEVWAQTFLADMDEMLSLAMACGAYNINSSALNQIASTKKQLAHAVAKGLALVLDIDDDTISITAAIEKLKQALLASLTDGYATSAVLQFDSSVTSALNLDTARLSGSATIVTPGTTTTTLTPTISDAKIPLAPDSNGRVTFILNVPDVARQEAIELVLSYAIVELEFNVQREIEGYDRSDWIAFVNPIGSGMPTQLSIQLGTPTTPLPLRAYPPVAVLLDQAAQPPRDPATVAEAVRWSYAFALRHQSAEQDRIQLTVNLNTPNLLHSQGPLSEDLFGALAQYVFVADPLRAMLAALKDEKSIPDPGVIATALTTFATLASRVATAWEAHWPDSTVDRTAHTGGSTLSTEPNGVDSIAFDLAMTLKGRAGIYKRLTLERDDVAEGFGWPTITCTLDDGSMIELCKPGTCGPGTPCDCDPNAGADDYLFPRTTAVPVNSLLSWRFVYPGLHVAHHQNATASVLVDRNAQLLPAPSVTNPAFVYQTPRASYGTPVTPFISVTETLDIGTWSLDPVNGPLPALFNTVFDNDPAKRTIAIGVRYGYQLAPGPTPDTSIETYLPVVQSPAMLYASNTQDNLVAAITKWQNQEQPVTDRGRWVLWLDLHSSIDANVLRPVLQLKRLESAISGS